MNSDFRIVSWIALGCWLLALVVLDTGCSHPPATEPDKQPVRALSSGAAAKLAATLANDECQRLYKRRPFVPSQYPALFRDGQYSWGYLDVGAPGGYSARVTFDRDGSHPRTEIYFSTDLLFPQR